MICRSEYDRAAQKYAWTVMVAAISGFALFLAIGWLIVLLVSPHAAAIRQWAQAFGPIAKTFFASVLFLAPSPVALVFLLVVVRRARRKLILRCPKCERFIGSAESANHIRRSGKCPHCVSELMSQDGLDFGVGVERKAPVWPYTLVLCAFGAAILVYAIPQPLPVQCVLAVVAVVNFVVAGYVVFRRSTESDLNAARLEHDR